MDIRLYSGFDQQAHNFFKHMYAQVVDTTRPDRGVLRKIFLDEVKWCFRHKFTAQDRIRLRDVFNFTYAAHKDTPIRDEGKAYIFHPVRATLVLVWIQYMFGVYDLEVLVDQLLHDCFEEVQGGPRRRMLQVTRVEHRFGYETAHNTLCVTKQDGETDEEYFRRMLASADTWRPLVVKPGDRIDNVWTIDKRQPASKRAPKLLETERWFPHILNRLEELITIEIGAGRLVPQSGWEHFVQFLAGYLWYAVAEKRKKYPL